MLPGWVSAPWPAAHPAAHSRRTLRRWDPGFRVHLEAYANDEEMLSADFGRAFKKLTELGCPLPFAA